MESRHPDLEYLASDARRELTENILPYWMNRAVDHIHGGFVGRIDANEEVVPDAPKGVVLNARILWTFSSAARQFDCSDVRNFAHRAYEYLREHFRDKEYGGVYWTLTETGQPLDRKKQVYGQSFVIYALAEYVMLTTSEEARQWALGLFELLEQHALDRKQGGYREALTQDWQTLEDVRLSLKDLNAPKTMNTHLHVLEAYTSLYRIAPDERVERAIRHLIDLFLKYFVDSVSGHLIPFFSMEWVPLSRTVSFGHDIEAAWLLDEAANVLNDDELKRQVRVTTLNIAESVLNEGLHEQSLPYERFEDGSTDSDRHWWAQAEAVVGFVNAWQQSGDIRFFTAAVEIWKYVLSFVVDHKNGEWRGRVDADRRPIREEDKVNQWKCPYHNGRACLQLMERAIAGIEAPLTNL